MFGLLLSSLLCALLAAAHGQAQKALGTSYPGQNTLAASHPLAITARDSNVVIFLPIAKSTAASLLPDGVKLLPTQPVTGFKDDEWPVLLNVGLDKDLSEYSVSRVDFHHGYIGIPWVDKSGNGKTPFVSSFDVLFSDNLFIAVSSQLLAGFNSIPMTFTPATDPFVNATAHYEAVKDQHTYFDLTYAKAGEESEKIARSTYVDVLTQGEQQRRAGMTTQVAVDHTLIADNHHAPSTPTLSGRFQNYGCLYHEQFFNYTNTNPFDILADVTVTDSWVPASIAGTYKQARGLRLNQQWIETINQPCNKQGTAHGEL